MCRKSSKFSPAPTVYPPRGPRGPQSYVVPGWEMLQTTNVSILRKRPPTLKPPLRAPSSPWRQRSFPGWTSLPCLGNGQVRLQCPVTLRRHSQGRGFWAGVWSPIGRRVFRRLELQQRKQQLLLPRSSLSAGPVQAVSSIPPRPVSACALCFSSVALFLIYRLHMVAKDWYLSNRSAASVSTKVCINKPFGGWDFLWVWIQQSISYPVRYYCGVVCEDIANSHFSLFFFFQWLCFLNN